MKAALPALILMASIFNSTILFDFDSRSSAARWQTEDDVVMGGRSDGNFTLHDDGYGIFEGNVSLENNGGFSSLINRHDPIEITEKAVFQLRVKGDGKRYQFWIKRDQNDYQSYVATFDTNGEWQEIEIPVSSMVPQFRGNRLNGPNFNHDYFEVTRFFIGNSRPQSFRLLIDNISLMEP